MYIYIHLLLVYGIYRELHLNHKEPGKKLFPNFPCQHRFNTVTSSRRGFRIEAKIEAIREMEMTINSNLSVTLDRQTCVFFGLVGWLAIGDWFGGWG